MLVGLMGMISVCWVWGCRLEIDSEEGRKDESEGGSRGRRGEKGKSGLVVKRRKESECASHNKDDRADRMILLWHRDPIRV